MNISTASLLDLNALRHLEKVCFPLDAWPLLDLLSVLSMPGVVRLKAVEDGQMIGFAAGDPHPSEGIGWIATLAVLPEQRGKGVGRALLEATEAACNAPILKLCVRRSNEEAIRMYLSAGYHFSDTWRNYYNDGEDALVMEKIYEIGVKFT